MDWIIAALWFCTGWAVGLVTVSYGVITTALLLLWALPKALYFDWMGRVENRRIYLYILVALASTLLVSALGIGVVWYWSGDAFLYGAALGMIVAARNGWKDWRSSSKIRLYFFLSKARLYPFVSQFIKSS